MCTSAIIYTMKCESVCMSSVRYDDDVSLRVRASAYIVYVTDGCEHRPAFQVLTHAPQPDDGLCYALPRSRQMDVRYELCTTQRDEIALYIWVKNS